MKKKIMGLVSVLLVVTLFVGLTHILSGTNKGFGSADEKIGFGSGNDITELVKEGNYLVSENDNFTLTLDTAGNPIVTDKSTGKIWKSVSDNADSGKYSSSVVAHYLSSNSAKSEYFSSEHSVDKNQMHIYEEQDGVKVEYAFGEVGEEYVYPDLISQKRLESFLKKVDDDSAEYIKGSYTLYELEYYTGTTRKFLLEQYPRLEKENLYVLMGAGSKKSQKKLDECFRSAGYTLEDRDEDNGDAESSVTRPCAIRISVSYKLTSTGFTASVNTEDCLFYSEYPLTSIDLLPNFDSYTTDESGYMVIPEGSGALMYFDDENKDDVALEIPVYGENLSVSHLYNSESNYSLPMFGQYKNNKGYICVIDEGAEQAKIKVERNLNTALIYPSFDILDNAGYKIGVQGDVYLTSSDFTTEKVTAEYILLNQLEEATAYSSMANTYRGYLKEQQMLSVNASTDPKLLTEIVNTINYDTVAYGIFPTNREFAVTSFQKTGEISAEISKWAGNENLKVLLTGYNKEGLNSGKVGKLTYSKAAGGKKEYTELQKTLSNLKIDAYSDLPISVVDSKMVSSAKTTLARNINNSISNLNVYDLQTSAYKGSSMRLVSSAKFNDLWKKYSDKGILSSGVGVSQLTSSLYGDYADGNLVSRGDSVKSVLKVLESAKKENLKLLGDTGNLYTLKYLDLINNISLSSSKNKAYDKEIPFVPMIIHGSVDYVGMLNNNSSNTKYDILKHIEMGSGLHYMITGEKYDDLFNTEYSYLYDTNYDAIKNEMQSSYLEVQKALKGLGKAEITEHIYLTDDVVRVTYDTGDVIYVNYGDEVYSGDVSVKANDYLRVSK